MRGRTAGLALLLAVCVLPLIGAGTHRDLVGAEGDFSERRLVTEVEYLGRASIGVGFQKDDTEIGGLSALTYDAAQNVYYVLSDDRSERDPARFYTVGINLADGALSSGDVVFQATTTLLNEEEDPFAPGSIDPEGIALSPSGTVFISSEGALAAATPISPAIIEFGLGGQQVRTLALPPKFLPHAAGTRGVRNNLSFESLTMTPNGRLLTGVENALVQDGPEADVDTVSLSRLLTFEPLSGQAVMETVYPTGPAVAPTTPAIPHGLVEMVALDNNGTVLTLERGPATSNGLTVRLYQSFTQGALNVSGVESLVPDGQDSPFEIDAPVVKELLLDFADLGLPFVNNFEGMALGPVLPDGRQTLVLVSDNNFSFVPTEFVALALTLESVPAALPTLETPLTHDDANAPVDVIAGAANDSAIWLHPGDPTQSMVAVTLRDGGLLLLNLEGEILQTVAPPNYGDFGYNAVDVLYNFPLDGTTADLLVLSDRRNDTLAVYAIDPQNRLVRDVTSPGMPPTLFGLDDGNATAYGLTTHADLRDGNRYAFVTQADGNLVAQVELTADGSGLVTGAVVRTLALPVPTGDAADSQAEGVAVDRFLGHLYVAMENEVGIVRFSAERDGGDDYTVIHALAGPYLRPPMGGLTIYYGPGDVGYLLASSQGDHTYAIFERRGGNAFRGSFIIAGSDEIDQANASKGVDVANVALGPDFPEGVLIVQDGANDPQNAVAEGARLANNSTNFKFVPWGSVANAFPEPLLVDTGSYNPRYPMRALLPVVSGN